uniref:Pectinesterase inhibitor domain-containing protein n=1 Tax=Nicotiana tabacum TaxID=4097 RepID=A0A1S4CSK3_TOBAC|nr:uncharacterized protein LOC104118692 [Nicotiana tomentosiformis]XP_016504061.1 PREDICTED: uncharacterized protein LOC107822079 [Nicotiana tabacum]
MGRAKSISFRLLVKMDKFTFQFSLLLCFLLFSPCQSNAAPISKPNNNNNATALLNKACSRASDKPFCMNYLKSNPKVMAATTSKPLDFALAIIQSGADQAKITHAYFSKPKGTKLSPQAIKAYNHCKNHWSELASGLERSVKNITDQQGYAYDTTDYDLKVNLDKAANCGRALESVRIYDPVFAEANKKVSLAVMGADAILVDVKPPKKLD